MVEAKAKAVAHKAKVDAGKAKVAEAKAAKVKEAKARARVGSSSTATVATNLAGATDIKLEIATSARPTYMTENITRVERVRMLLQYNKTTLLPKLTNLLLATATLPLVSTLS